MQIQNIQIQNIDRCYWVMLSNIKHKCLSKELIRNTGYIIKSCIFLYFLTINTDLIQEFDYFRWQSRKKKRVWIWLLLDVIYFSMKYPADPSCRPRKGGNCSILNIHLVLNVEYIEYNTQPFKPTSLLYTKRIYIWAESSFKMILTCNQLVLQSLKWSHLGMQD